MAEPQHLWLVSHCDTNLVWFTDSPDHVLRVISEYCHLETRFADSISNSALTSFFLGSVSLRKLSTVP